MTDGYIYGFSNPGYQGLLKVGMTRRTPEKRLREANRKDAFRLWDWTIIAAKKVNNIKEKEGLVHHILEKYHERPNDKEFFRVPTEDFLDLLSLMDGELWSPLEEDENRSTTTISSTNSEQASITSSSTTTTSRKRSKPREMRSEFTESCVIRCRDKVHSEWIFARYDFGKNVIIWESKEYTNPSAFVADCLPERESGNPRNGWGHIERHISGDEWQNFKLY